MTELPTRAQMFANCLSPLDTARGSLSEVRDWLRSDWQPLGASLTPEAGEARAAILDTLTEAVESYRHHEAPHHRGHRLAAGRVRRQYEGGP